MGVHADEDQDSAAITSNGLIEINESHIDVGHHNTFYLHTNPLLDEHKATVILLHDQVHDSSEWSTDCETMQVCICS